MDFRRRRIVSGVVLVAAFVALVALNELAFRALLDTDYFRWYLANGALISLAFGLVALAWGDLLNRHAFLISAHPAEYAGASVGLLTFPLAALGAAVQARRQPTSAVMSGIRRSGAEVRAQLEKIGYVEEHPPREPSGEEDDVPAGVPVVDLLLTLVFAVAFTVVVVAWLVVVVPLQYFVYLVTGAPAREACGSAEMAVFFRDGNKLVSAEASKSAELPKGAVESGFSARPVSFTAAITAGVLFAVSQLVS